MEVENFLVEVRRGLEDLNRRVLDHPFLREAESGVLPVDRLRLFVENQFYIVYHDARSLGLMVCRAKGRDEADYFARLMTGDLNALRELMGLGEELGLKLEGFEGLRILPGAVSYTHFLAWLAAYANPGEQAIAIIVNLPVWGVACGRLAQALRDRYGLRSTGFLEAFARPARWVESEGMRIVGNYLDESADGMRRVARMIQRYELDFWESVYHGV